MKAALTSTWRRFDPALVDCLVAVAGLTTIEVAIWTSSHLNDRLVHAIWAVPAPLALAVRRRWLLQALVPGLVLAVVFAAGWGIDVLRNPAGSVAGVVAPLLFYGAGAFLDSVRSLAALGVGLATISLIAGASGSSVLANLIWDDLILTPLPWFIGRMARSRNERAQSARERAERLDAEHEYHERAAALGERARLAREIHDVIAHSVSVMVIQAAGARTVMDREPVRADAALQSVERAGREALAEMRRLLGVLGEGDELRALAPQPSLDDLDQLIEQTNAAGLTTSLRVEGQPMHVSPGLSLCAYRVVQEALTNSLKHAGHVRAEVAIRWTGNELEVEVVDDGIGRPSAAGGEPGGHGIAGMRERAALHGGDVQTGPRPDGGFAVRARMPVFQRQAA